jgi:hypothetical protein
MKEVAHLLNSMRSAGVISQYALFGAIAQMRYTEPVATLDAEVLVAVPPPRGLNVLMPIYEFCASRGYQPEGEAIRVGAWPVQFNSRIQSPNRGSLGTSGERRFRGYTAPCDTR